MTSWDYEKQRDETIEVVASLVRKEDLFEGKPITLEVQTINSGHGDKVAYVGAIRTANFQYNVYDGDGETCEVEIVFRDAELSVESIWTREKMATDLALKHGFEPDGWGFFSERTEDA